MYRLIGLVCLLLSLATNEADAEAPTARAVETLVVTGGSRAGPEPGASDSVDRLGARDLDPSGVLDLRDLGARVPGLVVSTNSALVQPYLRGIGSDLVSAGLESSVAVVVDEVYRPRSAGALVDLFDVDRIDVLRGPQGFQFGRNATGGVIHLRTVRPAPETHAEMDVTYGSYELTRLRYALNLAAPSGKGAVRIAGMQKRQDGYMRNVIQREGLEGEDLSAVRVQGMYRPLDTLSILAGADYSLDQGTRGLTPRLAPPFDGSPALGAGAELPDDRLRVRLDRPPRAKNEQYGVRLEIDHQGSSYVVESTTSFRSNDLRERLDLDGTELPFVTNDVEEKSHSTSQELRIASYETDRFDWLLGGFLQHERVRQRLHPRFPTAGIDDRTTAHLTTHAYAFFALLGASLPADLRLAAGTRYSREQRELDFDESLNGSIVADFARDGSWDGWSPEVVLEWSPRQSLGAYAKALRGYKGGGFNTTAAQTETVKPETLWALELGGRASLLEDRLRIEGALFYYDYRDMQLQIVSPTASVLFPVVGNAGESTLHGLEAGFELAAPGDLAVDGRIAWLEAEFDRLDAVDVNQPTADPDQSGNRLPRAPRFALAVGAERPIDLDHIGRLTPRIEYRYQSTTHFDVFQDRATRQAGYGIVNLQIGFDAFEERFGVTLYAYNLADERYATSFSRVDGQFGNVSFIGSPRTLGIMLRAKL